MDFFLDSDDDHSVNDKKKKKNDDDGNFQCDNCGGDDSYMDSNTGGLCCTQCFTQSQSTIAASQVDMEMDETLGLMARTRQGAAIRQFQKKTDGPGRRKRKPLSDYDRTRRLPQVQDCIRGMQRIIKECSSIISDLAGADDKEQVFTNCKTIWNSYLQSWHDGAEQYGVMYPEVRFSFRDCFLDGAMINRVMRTLSYKAVDHVKQVLGEEKDEAKEKMQAKMTTTTPQQTPKKPGRKRRADAMPTDPIEKRRHDIEQILADASDSDNDNDTNEEMDDDVDNDNRSSNTTSKPNVFNLLQDDDDDNDAQALDFDNDNNDEDRERGEALASRLGPLHGSRIRLMLTVHNQSRPCGRKEVALALRPSMTIVAAILWMAVSPLGVTGGHICDWISNGSLPLINAFSLLSQTERTMLRPLEHFFALRDRTSVKSLTRAVASLQVICDYRPPSIIRRSDESSKHKTQNKVVFKQIAKQQAGVLKSKDHAADKIRSKYRYRKETRTKAFKPGQLLTPTSVPLMTARFVADLNLSQTVLNLALALMGVPTAKKTHKYVKGMPKHWIPPPLKRARPEKLQDPAHVLGVIVIACKLTPDWYTQDYQRPLSSDYARTTTNNDDNNDNSNDQTQSACIKMEDNDHALLVDKEEPERHTKRQKTMQARSRFVPWSEDEFRCLGNGPIMEGYLDFLEEQLVGDSSEVVLPDFIASLDTAAAAAKQWPITQEDPLQHQPKVRPCPTLWAPLRPQKVPKLNAFNACEVLKTSNIGTGSPPSLNLGMLIEFMAYRTCVEPSTIESFALELDDEIKKRFCIQDNVEMHPIALYRWIGDPRSTQVHEDASFQATATTELKRERFLKSRLNRSLIDKPAASLPVPVPVELERDDEDDDQVASEPCKRKPQSNAGAKKVRKPLARSAAKQKSGPAKTAKDTKQTQVQTISPAKGEPQSDTARENAENADPSRRSLTAQAQLQSENNAESSPLELQSHTSLPERVVQAFVERGEVEWI